LSLLLAYYGQIINKKGKDKKENNNKKKQQCGITNLTSFAWLY